MTDGLKRIVPWSCHICGRVFDIPYHGGVCAVCLEPTCRSHLSRVHDRDPSTGKRRLGFVCSSCRKSAGPASPELEARP